MPKAKKRSKGWNKKLAALLVFLAAAIVFTASYLFFAVSNHPKTAVESASTVTIPRYDHVITIMEENESSPKVIDSPDAPYISELAKKYALAKNYHGLTHPSTPNYIMMTSGTNGGIDGNCLPASRCQANVTSIADSLEQKDLSWKGYFEDMPYACDKTSTDKYDVLLNPFLYYPSIRNNKTRCENHVVPFDQFYEDLSAEKSLPNYAFIVPNICNDMHNCPISSGDDWLANIVPKILDSPAFQKQSSLLIIAWDESEDDAPANVVPQILIGAHVKKQFSSNKYFDHYSYLRTVEDALGLPPLYNTAGRSPMVDFFDGNAELKL